MNRLESKLGLLEANTGQQELQAQIKDLQANQIAHTQAVTEQKEELSKKESALQTCKNHAAIDNETVKKQNQDLTAKVTTCKKDLEVLKGLQELFNNNQIAVIDGVIHAKTAEIAAIKEVFDTANRRLSKAVQGSDEFKKLTNSIKSYNVRINSAKKLINIMNTYSQNIKSNKPEPTTDILNAISQESLAAVDAMKRQSALDSVAPAQAHA